MERSNRLVWARLSMDRSAKVHGLCFDVPKNTGQAASDIMDGVGVCQETLLPADGSEALKPPLLPFYLTGTTIPGIHFSFYLRCEKDVAAFSAASINDVAALYVRKRAMAYGTATRGKGYRCYGLYVVHHDSTVDVLGRWDPRDEESISQLYDASQASLMRLTFHLEQFRMSAIVENITVEVTDNPSNFQPRDDSTIVSNDPHDHECGETPEYDCEYLKTLTFDCTRSDQASSSYPPVLDTIFNDFFESGSCGGSTTFMTTLAVIMAVWGFNSQRFLSNGSRRKEG